MPSAARIAQAKADLRRRMSSVRAALDESERARLAGRIASRLLALPVIEESRAVLLFSSFGTEVPTAGIAARLLGEGRRVLIPFLDGRAMRAAEIRGLDDLVPTRYGPMEPRRRLAAPAGTVDAVVAPGLAFDRLGHRLGYGGGHYDRYLRDVAAHASALGVAGPTRIGVAFHVQLVEAVPAGRRDERLDIVVTDRETIVVQPDG